MALEGWAPKKFPEKWALETSPKSHSPQALLLSGGEQQRLAMARVLLRHLGSFEGFGWLNGQLVIFFWNLELQLCFVK